MSAAPWGGGRLLVDASAYAQASHPVVKDDWEEAVYGDRISVTSGLLFELLYSARSKDDYEEIRAELIDGFDVIYFDEDTWKMALEAQRELAEHKVLYHRRYSPIDLLTAAAAEQQSFGVLHYDEDYDEIKAHSSLEFESHWIGAKGTLDQPGRKTPMRARRRNINLLLGRLEDEHVGIADKAIGLLDQELAGAGIERPELLRDDP